MIVEKTLSDGTLLKLGKYVATHAHIEKMAWSLVVQSTGFDLDDAGDVHRILMLRKRTPDLVAELKKVAEAQSGEFRDRFTAIASEIDESNVNRHMAVHGTWTTRCDGRYEVEYYKNMGSRKKPDWKAFAIPVSEDEIDAALLAADDILSALLALYKDMDFL